jgi:Tat protein secretion system quality control protein TatD with DNase activity
LTETDAPWLSPVKFQRNEPMNVLESITQIAKIKKFNVEETADSIFLNYQRMFL